MSISYHALWQTLKETKNITLEQCQAWDQIDPLAELRNQFELPKGVIYLDGNSLGVLPKSVSARLQHAIQQEWGHDLIRSWNQAGWFEMPQHIGNLIAPLIGAAPNEVVATDTTSINVFKVMSAAMRISQQDAPHKRIILSETSNFPTDLYMAQSLCQIHGFELQCLDLETHPEQSEHDLITALATGQIAVLMLTHVNYRTGAMHDMERITKLAHQYATLVVWDLCHSAGAVEVDLNGSQADFAVGCGYKFLNGGPGCPAFVWVHAQHVDRFWQPLSGWWGHQAPFAFETNYRPASGMSRYLCGTQPILSMAGLQCGVESVRSALPFGGMAALRAKSLAQTALFMHQVQTFAADYQLGMVTPLEPERRGSQVSLIGTASQAGGWGAYAVVQALIGRGVIGDFRAGKPDIMRFGFTPLYLRFEDVWQASEHLRAILETKEWQRPEFNRRHAVT